MVDGQQHSMGLGGYPDLSLEEARNRARVAQRKAKDGDDPIEERKAVQRARRSERARSVTFDESAKSYIAAHRAGWKNAKHADQWTSTLATYASPVIGALQVRDVELAHIMRTIEPIWATKNETASRLRGRIESVLDWATVRGYRSGDNPARWRGHLDKLLPKPSKVQEEEHHPALPWLQMDAFMRDLRTRGGIAARALEVVILTACRSGEMRNATWSEFDLERGLWTIPAARMKAGEEHRIPLTERAMEILRTQPDGGRGAYVFPGAKAGAPMSDMTLAAVIKRMHHASLKAKGAGYTAPKLGGRIVTVHGFRSNFRDWAADATQYPRDMAEMAIAHTVSDETEAAYRREDRREDMFEKRRQMMEDWAGHCEASPVFSDPSQLPQSQNGTTIRQRRSLPPRRCAFSGMPILLPNSP